MPDDIPVIDAPPVETPAEVDPWAKYGVEIPQEEAPLPPPFTPETPATPAPVDAPPPSPPAAPEESYEVALAAANAFEAQLVAQATYETPTPQEAVPAPAPVPATPAPPVPVPAPVAYQAFTPVPQAVPTAELIDEVGEDSAKAVAAYVTNQMAAYHAAQQQLLQQMIVGSVLNVQQSIKVQDKFLEAFPQLAAQPMTASLIIQEAMRQNGPSGSLDQMIATSKTIIDTRYKYLNALKTGNGKIHDLRPQGATQPGVRPGAGQQHVPDRQTEEHRAAESINDAWLQRIEQKDKYFSQSR